MRELIEKLAKLYPDIENAKRILVYANLPIFNIPFNPAAQNNWVGIVSELLKNKMLLLELFNEIIEEYENEKDFFLKYIGELNAGTFGVPISAPATPAEPVLAHPLMPSFPSSPVILNFSRKDLKRLVTANKIKEVFLKLEKLTELTKDTDSENKIMLLQTRYNSLQESFHQRAIQRESYLIEYNTIIDTILHRIDKSFKIYLEGLEPRSPEPLPLIDSPAGAQEIDPKIFNRHSVFDDEFSFLNRQSVRRNFKKMILGEVNKRILLIEGKSKSGLTHIQLYIAEILQDCEQYKLVQIMIEPHMAENNMIPGVELAKEITSQLDLTYEPEEANKLSLSKYTTFFTKLKEYHKEDDPSSQIPVICLDGMHHISNPNLDNYISLLLHEAAVSKKFYVIFTNTLSEENRIKENWPYRLQNITPIILDSFTVKDVETFVETVYSSYNEKADLGFAPKVFTKSWMENNQANLSFDEETLNVQAIGETCTKWYKDFSLAVENQIDES